MHQNTFRSKKLVSHKTIKVIMTCKTLSEKPFVHTFYFCLRHLDYVICSFMNVLGKVITY